MKIEHNSESTVSSFLRFVFIVYSSRSLLKYKVLTTCFIKFFFPFYHNKIHPATNYNAIKNKIKKNKITQDMYFISFFNKQNKNKNTHTNTHIHTKKDKKENEIKLLAPALPPFLF